MEVDAVVALIHHLRMFTSTLSARWARLFMVIAMSSFATQTFAQNRDAYSKNYYLHHELSPDARFRLISWDADATFCQRWDGVALPPDDTRWHGWDVFSPRLLGIDSYREAYVADYLDALDHELAAEGILASIDALEA